MGGGQRQADDGVVHEDGPPALSHAGETAGAGQTTASMGLWPWFRLAVSRGRSLETFCELAGIEVSALRDSGRRFSQPVANRVAQLSFTQFGSNAALEAALTIEPGHFDLLELIARSAASVGEGLEQGCRFFSLLHDGGRLVFERLEAGAIALRWRPLANCYVHYGYVELTFAVAVIGVRRETAQEGLVASRVRFSHAAPADTDLYPRVLGVQPHFSADADEIVFDSSVAELPLRRRNQELHVEAVRSGAELVDD